MKIVVAKTSFSTEVNGHPEAVVQGKSLLREDDPIVKQNPEYFESAERAVQEVEEATAAPAEKRGAKKKRPAAKKTT